jgi:hypothetical protein
MLAPAGASASDPQFTWAGHHFPRNWSEAGNWAGGVAPAAGEGPVDLKFPLAACEPWPALCPTSTDDLDRVLIGRLTLEALVIRWEPVLPFEFPSEELKPEDYSVTGSEPLDLAGGIDLVVNHEGSGEGTISDGGASISSPIELVADNSWSVGPTLGENLNIVKPLGGAHSLSVTLAMGSGLQFDGGGEVGPVTISGSRYSHVSLGGEEGFNSADGDPVVLEDVSAEDVGHVGPLTLGPGSWLDAGTRIVGGATEVLGALHAEAGATIGLYLPGSSEWAATLVRATGPAQLDGATLQPGEGCIAPGSTYTLIEAAGGISGSLRTPEGESITDGQVLPGAPEGCGPGVSAPPLRIDYSAHAVTATAPGSAPSPQGSGPGGANSGAGTPSTGPSGGVAAYAALARTLLAQVLTTTGGHKRIETLLRHDGETTTVGARIAGTLTVRWTTRRGRHTITLAVGMVNLSASGGGRLRIALTRSGRALLRHSGRLRGEALADLSAPGHAGITQSVPLLLRP